MHRYKRRLLLLCAFLLAVLFVCLRYPLRYYTEISLAANKYNLEPSLIYAVIRAESSFNPKAISRKDACGLMQLRESTAVWLAGEMGLEDFSFKKIFEPDLNIDIGCYYLRKLLTQYDNELATALAAYNAGSGNVGNWLNNRAYSSEENKLNKIPFGETDRYIKKIKMDIQIYQVLITAAKIGRFI